MNWVIQKNDAKAKWLIWTVSIVVFAVVVLLSRVKLDVDTGFDVHIFAAINAVINSIVALLLIGGIITAKRRNYAAHPSLYESAPQQNKYRGYEYQ